MSTAEIRLRPSTRRLGSRAFKAVIVREKWSRASHGWNKQATVWESLETYPNRDMTSYTSGISAIGMAANELARFIHLGVIEGIR